MQNVGGLAEAAKVLQSRGRGDDSMLIHMTPREVGGLQALALASGGSLTTNPDTGLPEAGWLGDLLPTLIGVGMNFILPGSGLLVAGLTGLGTGIATGDLGKGLMAGLGAFGGASLGAGLFGGAASGAAGGASGSGGFLGNLFGGVKDSFAQGVLGSGATAAPGSAIGAGVAGAPSYLTAAQQAAAIGSPGVTPAAMAATLPTSATGTITPTIANSALSQGQISSAIGNPGVSTAFQPNSGFLGNAIGAAENANVGSGLEALGNAGWKSGAAALGLAAPFMQQQGGAAKPKDKNTWGDYGGPYLPTDRGVQFPTDRAPNDSSEFSYFNDTNPVPGFVESNPQAASTLPGPMDESLKGRFKRYRYAAGGVNLPDGAFVMDARTVSELGNGSSGAGQELLARHGGMPIQGPGDGVNDAIRANVGGTQEARVSRDEVMFDPAAVARFGGGNHSTGTQKLYNLMDRARQSRGSTQRGASNGLGGLAR
mgnify:CR=1 FL=1